MPRRARRQYCIDAQDDGLPARDVGSWVEEKYRRLGMFSELFATGMKAKWDARVYIDLYAGAGFSRVRRTSRLLYGSPLIALSLPHPFDRYIFCESDAASLSALKSRVERLFPNADVRFLPGDVNENVQLIAEEIPQPRRGRTVLSFCFVDPFSLQIRFDTLRCLADGRGMDFLILLALGVDANRNLARYVAKESDRIDLFLGTDTWRERWKEASARGEDFVYFLAREFAEAMRRIGYLPTAPDEMHPVRSDDKNLPLYYLAFFSKRGRGKQFWKQVEKYASDQQEMSL